MKIYTETHQIALLFSKFLEGAYFKINTKTYRLNMFSKQISGANYVPHNKRVAIIIVYIENDNFLRQNLIKIFTKTHNF